MKNGPRRPPPAPFSDSLLMTSSNMVYWPSSPANHGPLWTFCWEQKTILRSDWISWIILWPQGGWRGETSRSTKPPGWEIQRIIYSQTLQDFNLAGKIFLLWHRISFWGERTPGALLSLTWTGPRVGVGRGEITLVHVTIQLQHQDWHVSILTPPSKSIQIVYEVH